MESLQADDPAAVGSHRLLGRLGGGGYGPVYLARSPEGRTVVVRVAHPEVAADDRVRARLREEFAAARALPGPYLLPVVDADPDARLPWAATDFLPAPTLRSLVQRHGPLPAQAVRALGAGLAAALDGLHTAGLLHRDLKPSNVLLTPEGPRLLDFGLARAVDGPRIDRKALVVGSPAYFSPELARGKEAGPAGEVFSLGAVLAYAATGRDPFGAATTAALLYHVAHGRPDLSGVPEELRAVLADCLSRKPAPRPTPLEVRARLQPDGGGPGDTGGAFAGWLAKAVQEREALVAQPPANQPPSAEPPAGPLDEPPAEPGSVESGSEPAPVPGAADVPPGGSRSAESEPRTLTLGLPRPESAPAPAPAAPAAPLGTFGAAPEASAGNPGQPVPPRPASAAPAPSNAAAPGRSRRRVLGVAAGALGAAALGVGVTALLGSSDSTHESAAPPLPDERPPGEPSPERFTTPPPGTAPTPLWSRDLDGFAATSSRGFHVHEDIAYLPGNPLRALNTRTGKQIWTSEDVAPHPGGWVTGRGMLFLTGLRRDCSLIGLSLRTGEEEWRTRLADGLAARAPLAADDEHLYAVAEDMGASIDEGSSDDGGAVLCAVALDGSRRTAWSVRLGPEFVGDSTVATATPGSAGFLAYGLPGGAVTVRDAATGRTLWQTRVSSGSAPTPVIADDLLLLGGSELRAHHLRTGKEIWRQGPRKADGFLTPSVLGGTGYAFESGGALWSFDPHSGKPRYVRTASGDARAGEQMALRGDNLYVASPDGSHGVRAHDSRTGSIRWTFRDLGDASKSWHLALAGQRLLALHGARLHCLPAV